MSFTNASPLRPTTKLVGFENYRYLFQDDVYWQVLGNTIFILECLINIEEDLQLTPITGMLCLLE